MTHCEWVQLLVEYVQCPVRAGVAYMVVDGERHTLDRVLKVRLRHCRVIQENGRARRGLLEAAPVVQLQKGTG